MPYLLALGQERVHGSSTAGYSGGAGSGGIQKRLCVPCSCHEWRSGRRLNDEMKVRRELARPFSSLKLATATIAVVRAGWR